MTKPSGLAAIAGALSAVPAPAGFPSGPAPRSSSEQPAPTLGSLLSFAGKHCPAWQEPPIGHFPGGGSDSARSIVTLLEPRSASAHPDARTDHSSSRATAANAYLPLP